MLSDQTILQSTAEGQLVLPSAHEMQKQITDTIRAFMLNAMPREAVEKLVEGAWKHFTTPRQVNKGDQYRPVWEEAPSPLQAMFNDEMKRQLVLMVKEWGDEFRKAAKDGDKANAAIRVYYKDLTELAAKSFFENLSGQIVAQAVSEVGNSLSCQGCGRLVSKSNYSPGCGWSCPHCGHYNN